MLGGGIVATKMLEKWFAYLTGVEFWEKVLNSTIKIVIIVFLSFIAIRIGNRIIDKIFKDKEKVPLRINKKREQTIKILLKSTLMYTVYFIAIIMVLESMSIPISTLLAGAGIAGLAIGFGAQSLVKDVISGFFIIFEKQFSIDDYVFIADIEGTVVEIGLRTTKVLGWTGEEHVIPNGNITQVINYSVNNGVSVVDVHMPYEINIHEAEQKINDSIQKIPQKYDFFASTPEIQGVRELDIANYIIRVIAETEPASQWQGERVIRKEIQNDLYKDGIYIPLEKFIVHTIEQRDDFVSNHIHRKD